MRNIKKIAGFLMLLVLTVLLASCKKPVLTVTFDLNGGKGQVNEVKVEKGKHINEPKTPEKDGQSFVGWTLDDKVFHFEKEAIKKNMKLVAKWHDGIVVNFKSGTKSVVFEPQLYKKGEEVEVKKPEDPTKKGFKFGGWFKTRAKEHVWDNKPVELPLKTKESMTLWAFWIPEDSKKVNWKPEQTYTTAMTKDTAFTLNPLTYAWNHEITIMQDMLSTQLFGTVIDWDKAIKDKIADFPGDFSKFVPGGEERSIDELDYCYVLEGATEFPRDKNGNNHVDKDGKLDKMVAADKTSDEWTFKLRKDVKFENGDPVTAKTYEFTLKQFLDPKQSNSRANMYYRSSDHRNGIPINKAYEYFSQDPKAPTVEWKEVGFEVINDYEFKIKTFQPISQKAAMDFGDMILLHPETFEKSLTNGVNSTYGTAKTLFVSYGRYVIKDWSENQRYVFNKNYDYINRHKVNYKCQVMEVVENVDQKMKLFKEGKLNSTGISKEYYKEYVNDPTIERLYSGYPQCLNFSLMKSKTHEHPTILFNPKFRKALFFAFNRKEYARDIYAPNQGSIVPYPATAKMYYSDQFAFADEKTPEFLKVLKKHEIDYTNLGYDVEKAKKLFDEAYEEWIKEGNSGAAKITLLSRDDNYTKNLNKYLKNSFEKVFNKDPKNPDRLIIELKELNNEANKAKRLANEYDIAFGSVGFGVNSAAHEQLLLLAFAGAEAGGLPFGLSHPIDMSGSDLRTKVTYKYEVDYDKTNDESSKIVYKLPAEKLNVDIPQGFNFDSVDKLVVTLKGDKGETLGVEVDGVNMKAEHTIKNKAPFALEIDLSKCSKDEKQKIKNITITAKPVDEMTKGLKDLLTKKKEGKLTKEEEKKLIQTLGGKFTVIDVEAVSKDKTVNLETLKVKDGSKAFELEEFKVAAYFKQKITVDMNKTYKKLQEKYEEFKQELQEYEEKLKLFQKDPDKNANPGEAPEFEIGNELLYNNLKDTNGKKEGTLSMTIELLSQIFMGEETVFSGDKSKEPFIGAGAELTKLTAALYDVFLENMTCIPLVTRTDCTVYKENVLRQWPKYSEKFRWGPYEFSYLTSDDDFVDLAK